jgi:hypothetical protein
VCESSGDDLCRNCSYYCNRSDEYHAERFGFICSIDDNYYHNRYRVILHNGDYAYEDNVRMSDYDDEYYPSDDISYYTLPDGSAYSCTEEQYDELLEDYYEKHPTEHPDYVEPEEDEEVYNPNQLALELN